MRICVYAYIQQNRMLVKKINRFEHIRGEALLSDRFVFFESLRKIELKFVLKCPLFSKGRNVFMIQTHTFDI